MATNHSGNIENQILQEEHDGSNNAKRVNVVAGGAGLATVQPLAAWPDPKTYIGLVTITGSLAPAAGNVTLDPGSKTQIVGNVTLSDPKGFIGLVTVVGSLSPAAGNVTLDPGSKTGIVGNVTLSDAKTFIGLTTTTLGSSIAGIGFATVNVANSVGIAGNVTLSDAKTFIGLVTIGGGPVIAAGDIASGSADSGNPVKIGAVYNSTQPTYTNGQRGDLQVGSRGSLRTELFGASSNSGVAVVTNADGQSAANSLAVAARLQGYNGTTFDLLRTDTTNGLDVDVTRMSGNVTLSDAKTFIGLVTATALIAGTTKTLLRQPIGFSVASQATIAVPTNANKINVTQLVLNSDATTSVRIKSGVTYLTGNASIGVTLNPGGGWVMPGSVDSPAWIGLPSGALIIEKFDLTGTSAKIGGGVVYFDEA